MYNVKPTGQNGEYAVILTNNDKINDCRLQIPSGQQVAKASTLVCGHKRANSGNGTPQGSLP